MYSINLININQAHTELKKLWLKIKNELQSGNKQVVTLMSYEESLTLRQRKYLHGYIYLTISQTVIINGNKYSLKAWKEHYREKFLGDEVVEVTDIKTGATKKELRRVSSESLSVKGYNNLIEQVTADAASEFGVIFDANFEQWEREYETT